ncbi:MAG: hypothetical protein JSC189_000056 [Candidatus Tokpelaia sp. JSC189]|nr:MAG: hypothetical protein JSC189_000056 [Candidatus Tokpelaia sp. JSC189]
MPWIRWKKGSGVDAKVEITVSEDIKALKNIKIDDFKLSGDTFQISGKTVVKDGDFISADFSKIFLNRIDEPKLASIVSTSPLGGEKI